MTKKQEPPAFECVVSADLFARAQIGVSTEETRYCLNGVHVSPAPEGGAILAATDGSMLIAVRDPEAHVTGEAIIQLDKPMLRALPVSGVLLERRLLLVRIAAGGKGRAFVVDQPSAARDDPNYTHYQAAREVFDNPDKRVKAAQFGAVHIDGKFPDWRRVLPTSVCPDAPCPPFAQDLLAKIAKALCSKRESRLVITPGGPDPANGPMLITAFDRRSRDAFAILMPLRHDRRTDSVPDWARVAAALAA